MKSSILCLWMVVINLQAIATKEDWRNLPMTEIKLEIPLDLHYTIEEFDRIREGFIPKEMEDKWFIWVGDGHIFFHRSWTGIMIYDCLFEERDGQVRITSLYANRNAEEYSNTDDRIDVLTVKDWLDWLSLK